MNIYLLNIPIAIVGVSIVLVPLVHKFKHHDHAAHGSRPSPSTTHTPSDDRADDFDYVR